MWKQHEELSLLRPCRNLLQIQGSHLTLFQSQGKTGTSFGTPSHIYQKLHNSIMAAFPDRQILLTSLWSGSSFSKSAFTPIYKAHVRGKLWAIPQPGACAIAKTQSAHIEGLWGTIMSETYQHKNGKVHTLTFRLTLSYLHFPQFCIGLWGYRRLFDWTSMPFMHAPMQWSYIFVSAKEFPVIVFTLPICADLQKAPRLLSVPSATLKTLKGTLPEHIFTTFPPQFHHNGTANVLFKVPILGQSEGLALPLCNLQCQKYCSGVASWLLS